MQKMLLKPVVADRGSLRKFGQFVSDETPEKEVEIPFYKGVVEEGENFEFHYRGAAVLRSVKIHPSDRKVRWLERHMHLSQLFVGLGSSPFIMVLSPPNLQRDGTVVDTPDIEKCKAFSFPPGTGIILDRGVWHDFPMAIERPVGCLTANSIEVVDALKKMKKPQEMNQGDIRKLSLEKSFDIIIEVNL